MSKEVRSGKGWGLSAGTIAFFAGFAAVALYGVTVHRIAPILHLSIIQIGWLVAIPITTGAFLRIPFSAWVDSWGGRKVLLTQLIIAIIGMAGLVGTVNGVVHHSLLGTTAYALLLFFGALAGTGVSTFSSGITYVSYWFPKSEQGTALGTYAGIGNTAPGIFTVILPFALISVGLVGAYVGWLVFLVIMTIIFAVIGWDNYYQQLLKKGMPEGEARKKASALGQEIFPTNAKSTLAKSARHWQTWLMVVMYFISFGGFEALTEWLPTYWTKFLGISIVEAGLLTGVVYSLITALTRVPGGYVSDKWGGEKTSLTSYIILVIGALIMMASHSVGLSIVGEVIMATGMGVANAAVFKLIPKYMPEAVGGGSGWIGGLGSGGGLAIPPTLAAFVAMMGKSGFAYGFIVYVIFGIISAIFSAIFLKLYGKYRHSITEKSL